MTAPVASDLPREERLSGAHVVRDVPTATYRLQLHGGFTFRDASADCGVAHSLKIY